MKLLEKSHEAFSRAFRPISDIRGAGRVCRSINGWCLRNGLSPIRKAKMLDGTHFRIDLRSQTEWYAFYSGSYDDAAINLILTLLSKFEGDFLDVGGNIGMYAIRVAAGLEKHRRSICFEPIPNNAKRIRENSELNALSDRLLIHQVALSDKEDEVELVLREDFEMGAQTGNASIAISEDADQGFKRIRVQSSRFDDICDRNGFGPLPVAKVDIEGHEDFFLSGAQKYLSRDRPIILMEINNWFYEKRGTTSSNVLSNTFPPNYRAALLRGRGSKYALKSLPKEQLAGLRGIETCIFVPEEKQRDLEQALA